MPTNPHMHLLICFFLSFLFPFPPSVSPSRGGIHSPKLLFSCFLFFFCCLLLSFVEYGLEWMVILVTRSVKFSRMFSLFSRFLVFSSRSSVSCSFLLAFWCLSIFCLESLFSFLNLFWNSVLFALSNVFSYTFFVCIAIFRLEFPFPCRIALSFCSTYVSDFFVCLWKKFDTCFTDNCHMI